MLQCHTCGGNIRGKTGVQRLIKTGSYTGGSGYYRTVNLCSRCDEERTCSERLAKVKKTLLILTGAAALTGGIAYFWFNR